VCGYGVIEVDARDCRYVECGVLTANERLPMEVRLGEIARGLREVIGELEPGLMGVEDVFTHQNHRSALALAQARGMVLAVAGMAGITVCSYAPSVVKKTVTGRGGASKDQVARMVQVLVGLGSLPRADASDALAVAITCAMTRELGEPR
jgi:crossover junction endodeoxyribonuclease RuvC